MLFCTVNGFAAVNLKIVFLPLLAFEITILVDNFRMCKALLPRDDESMSGEAIWETLPTRNATGLVASAIVARLGVSTHTFGTFVLVIGASGFATATAATAIGTVVVSFR
ncbi:uncharacterized protein LOC114257492 [Camellia sinensis]|uniref:uncharacterized protein LOC114257492 n=1 Tax=Camellia sinensis TaxID=4442 RepID=UPI0010357053|nr:uncharacterized protein LOC114257492 [Camellia sinensis]